MLCFCRLALTLPVLLVHGRRVPASASFEEYSAAFGRSYRPGSSEYRLRRSLFERRAEEVQAHNAVLDRRWTAGLNALTDRTDEELLRLQGWRRPAALKQLGRSSRGFVALLASGSRRIQPHQQLPHEIDWSHLAASQRVLDQGDCGSCWAVTSAHVIQAHHEIHMGGNRTFSVQELVSCVENPHHCGGTGGCRGATVELAMGYVEKYGLREDSQMPYTQGDSRCPNSMLQSDSGAMERHEKGGASFGLVGWSKLPENEALPLMQAVLEGPVGISVASDRWNLYEGGIFDGCAPDAVIGHAVTLIGFGEETVGSSLTKYWTIQNSWGPHWGEDGRVRLLRHNTASEDDAFCGVDDKPELGTACEPYPQSERVCGMCGLLYDSVRPHFASAQARGRKMLRRADAK